MATALKKGNVVSVTVKSLDGTYRTVEGVVASVGKAYTKINYDQTPENYRQISIPSEMVARHIQAGKIKFVSDSRPRPALPKGLETVQAKGLKQFNTHDGVAFSVNIYFKGKQVATYSNGGYGGPDQVDRNYKQVDLFKEFEELVLAECKRLSVKSFDGDLEYFCGYIINHSELQNFEEFVEYDKKQWEEFKRKNGIKD